MAGNIIEITDAGFDSIVRESDIPVLVDFWAPWCGPCRMVAPMVEEIAAEYSGKLTVGKVNIDDDRQAATEFGISAIPTIILFKDGKVEKKWVGLTSKKNIAAAVDELV